MGKDGEMTARLGNYLQGILEKDGLTVIYDHGDHNNPNVGVISSIIGDSLQRGSKLTEIDIAIRNKEKKVVFLIEIEESDDNPKKLIGDVLTTLIGDKIYFRDEEIHQIDKWTTLIVLAKKTGEDHEKRTREIEKRIIQLISNKDINGLNIKHIKLSLFKDEDDLMDRVKKFITINSQNA